ncbi:MAG: DUF3104 domain-containing protein [Vulcanococcus sp.]
MEDRRRHHTRGAAKNIQAGNATRYSPQAKSWIVSTYYLRSAMDEPRFLAVQVGDLVAVQGRSDWWVGQVIHAEGGARCNANSLFQIACIDTGVIRTVNADGVIDILAPRPEQQSGAFKPAHNQRHQPQGSSQRNQQGNRHEAAWQRR